MEVWPSGLSAFVSLLEPPGFYAAMVAAEEHLGHLAAAPFARTRVVRAVEEGTPLFVAAAEGVLRR